MTQLSNAELAQKLTNVVTGWQEFVDQQLSWLLDTTDSVTLENPFTAETFPTPTLHKIVADYEAVAESTLQQYAADASASADLAEQWAEEVVDTEVEVGKYSALHHSTKAGDSATAAATSETNAATSETNAATSEASASQAATNASTSETNAAASEAAAGTSETNAAASEAAAGTSETNAASSETESAASESQAKKWAEESEDVAVTTGKFSALHHAAKASNSEAASLTSEQNAAASATSADASATAAASSETAAATSETNAATSETNAASSETAAATSETNAASSETAAGTSETNAAASAALSEDWAVEAEDIEVQPGLYSAYHWAQKAEVSAAGAFSDITLLGDGTSASPLSVDMSEIAITEGQVSGLGTGATSNVTTSTTDTAAGRLTRVGDFGLGNDSGTPPWLDDLNDTTKPTGQYFTSDTTANIADAPTGADSDYAVITIKRYNAGVITQEWTQVVRDWWPHRVWVRSNHNDNGLVWSAWKEVATHDSVGTLDASNTWTGSNKFQLQPIHVDKGDVAFYAGPSGTPPSYGFNDSVYFALDRLNDVNDCSFLFLSDGALKAEFGLISDNDFHIKTVTGPAGSETFTDKIILRNAVEGFVDLVSFSRTYDVTGTPIHVVGNSDRVSGAGLELEYSQPNFQGTIRSVEWGNTFRRLRVEANGHQFFSGGGSLSEVAHISHLGTTFGTPTGGMPGAGGINAQSVKVNGSDVMPSVAQNHDVGDVTVSAANYASGSVLFVIGTDARTLTLGDAPAGYQVIVVLIHGGSANFQPGSGQGINSKLGTDSTPTINTVAAAATLVKYTSTTWYVIGEIE